MEGSLTCKKGKPPGPFQRSRTMSVDYEAVESSYQRCLDHKDFFNTFYDLFLLLSEEIPPLFANTDFKRQQQIVRISVLMMIRLGEGRPETRQAIEKLGELHSRRDRNVRPELYQLYQQWVDTLCECVQRFDPQYSPLTATRAETARHHETRHGLMISMY